MAGPRRVFALFADPRRVWSFDRNEAIDNAFFERRLQQAQTWREWLAAAMALTAIV
jgi:23S rRNA G2069 N7-methylase RlmK/C1962 C5-methylase RlmI